MCDEAQNNKEEEEEKKKEKKIKIKNRASYLVCSGQPAKLAQHLGQREENQAEEEERPRTPVEEKQGSKMMIKKLKKRKKVKEEKVPKRKKKVKEMMMMMMMMNVEEKRNDELTQKHLDEGRNNENERQKTSSCEMIREMRSIDLLSIMIACKQLNEEQNDTKGNKERW